MISNDLENFQLDAYNNEHEILKKLQHTNIIKFYENFATQNHLCFVMEYCEQGDLLQKIKEAKANQSYFSEEQIIEWFCQICLAVQHLHENRIIHRDIKVHNIFLTSSGFVKLGDFGISKQLEHSTDLSQTQIGTPLYLSPEMVKSSTSSYKSDVWMLGCLLHELCSLEKPFKGKEFLQVAHQIIQNDPDPIPQHYSLFLHKLHQSLLEKEQEKRPSIHSILALPEIQRGVEELYNKFPENYLFDDQFVLSQDPPTEEEALRRVTSDSTKTSTSNFPRFPERTKSNSVSLSAKLKPPAKYFEESDKVDIIEPNSENLTKSPSLKGFIDEGKEFASPKVRRSNNIWSLVQQKKGQQPSNGQESPLIRIKSSPSNQAIFKLHEPSPSQAGSIAKAIKIFESPPLMPREMISPTKKLTLAEKECESTRKGLKLSIKIPGGSPLQGSPEQSQIRELPHLDTLESAKSGIVKAGPFRLTMLDQATDQNTIPTTKTAAKKEFTFTNLVFENKSPKSPSRSLWVPQFLKGKLGKEKYEQVLGFLERSSNPLEILKDQPERVLEIIGEENRECLVMLSFLMSNNSATPTANPVNKEVEWLDRKNSISSKTPKKFNIFQKNIFPTGTHSPNLKNNFFTDFRKLDKL